MPSSETVHESVELPTQRRRVVRHGVRERVAAGKDDGATGFGVEQVSSPREFELRNDFSSTRRRVQDSLVCT